MSHIPSVNVALDYELPHEAHDQEVYGAYWQPDWRGIFPVAPDAIHNYDKPVYLGVLDGTEAVTDWNPWEGVTGPHVNSVIRFGHAREAAGVQEFAQAAPLAIDAFDRNPDHGQARPSGVMSIAALVPFLELPDYGQGVDPSSTAGLSDGGYLPYHYDLGWQVDMSGLGAIGPRQVFRSPPSVSDQTAGVYAAGF